MSHDDSDFLESSPEDNHVDSAPESAIPSEALTPNLAWRKLRIFVLGCLIVTGSGLLFTGLLTAASGWYTSRSEFCNSCHIMEPYYQSWEESSHSHVACIKCHFPPGAAEKMRGKLLGLVQLAKYVTRSQGPRPMAEIPDASCLRSGCHETRTLAGKVDFHGIPFDHTPHLEKLRRGKKLRCTSCHSQIVQGKHIAVTTSTCFLCHFKEGHFNEGLGACTRCHQIPEQTFELGGDVSFSHELAYEKGIDCQNCHGDLIRGDGNVSRGTCQTCHNRELDINKISDHVLMHKIHVTDHKVDCMDCHQEIEHSLEPQQLANAAADCISCHPNHHQEQINMLQGVGGLSIPDRNASMMSSRVACRACHRIREVSSTGTVLWRASAEVCTACHSSTAAEKLQAYTQQMSAALSDLEEAIERVQTAIADLDLEPAELADLRSKINKIEHDTNFLKIGNGIHNIHYASTLARVLFKEIADVCREVGIPEPTNTLPEKVDELDSASG